MAGTAGTRAAVGAAQGRDSRVFRGRARAGLPGCALAAHAALGSTLSRCKRRLPMMHSDHGCRPHWAKRTSPGRPRHQSGMRPTTQPGFAHFAAARRRPFTIFVPICSATPSSRNTGSENQNAALQSSEKHQIIRTWRQRELFRNTFQQFSVPDHYYGVQHRDVNIETESWMAQNSRMQVKRHTRRA